MVATVNNYIPDLLISKTKLFVFSSVANSLELLLVEQILTNLTNSKLKFDLLLSLLYQLMKIFFKET